MPSYTDVHFSSRQQLLWRSYWRTAALNPKQIIDCILTILSPSQRNQKAARNLKRAATVLRRSHVVPRRHTWMKLCQPLATPRIVRRDVAAARWSTICSPTPTPALNTRQAGFFSSRDVGGRRSISALQTLAIYSAPVPRHFAPTEALASPDMRRILRQRARKCGVPWEPSFDSRLHWLPEPRWTDDGGRATAERRCRPEVRLTVFCNTTGRRSLV